VAQGIGDMLPKYQNVIRSSPDHLEPVARLPEEPLDHAPIESRDGNWFAI